METHNGNTKVVIIKRLQQLRLENDEINEFNKKVNFISSEYKNAIEKNKILPFGTT